MAKKILGWTVGIIVGFLIIRAVAADPAGAATHIKDAVHTVTTFLTNL